MKANSQARQNTRRVMSFASPRANRARASVIRAAPPSLVAQGSLENARRKNASLRRAAIMSKDPVLRRPIQPPFTPSFFCDVRAALLVRRARTPGRICYRLWRNGHGSAFVLVSSRSSACTRTTEGTPAASRRLAVVTCASSTRFDSWRRRCLPRSALEGRRAPAYSGAPRATDEETKEGDIESLVAAEERGTVRVERRRRRGGLAINGLRRRRAERGARMNIAFGWIRRLTIATVRGG